VGKTVRGGEVKQELNIPENPFFTHSEKVGEVLRRAVRHALRTHKRLGNPVATWRDGEVIMISPEEILVEDEVHDRLN